MTERAGNIWVGVPRTGPRGQNGHCVRRPNLTECGSVGNVEDPDCATEGT